MLLSVVKKGIHMVIKKLITLTLLSFILSCSQNNFKNTSEENNFLNYALSICLGSAFENEITKSDFNKSANGFMERGNMPLEAYEELRTLVDIWLQKNYPSKHGGQVNSAKCIDFYVSNDVQLVFGKYNPCKSKGSWLNEEDFSRSCTSTNRVKESP